MKDGLDPSDIKKARKKVEEFLSTSGMHYLEIDILKYVDLFVHEMQQGLSGNASSLKMFPTYIGFKRSIPPDEPVIVLDAGGTNLRSALLSFNRKNKPVITSLNKTDMPGIDREVTKAEFFKAIAENVKNIIERSHRIGFVFSYPIEIYPDRDARLVSFTKEIKAREVEGEFIGRNLLDAAKEYLIPDNPRKFVILNDTVATLLSGVSAFCNREYESYIGFVLGTGMNACYIEKNSNIEKASGAGLDPDEYQLINIEAGNFSKGPWSVIDQAFDKQTLNPGLYTYEKMFSGAYFGGLALEVIKYAAGAGIFSGKFVNIINEIAALESKNVDDFLFYPPEYEPLRSINKDIDEADRTSLFFLFDSLVERSAILATIVLAAAIIKSGKGRNPCNPVCIVAEGSSYYKMKDFRSRVYKYLEKVLSEKGDYYFEINRVDNAVMVGAAVAALTCL